jgi:hypothetical protein
MQEIRSGAGAEGRALDMGYCGGMPFTRFVHWDPGDRFLVTTAKVFDLTLVTGVSG